MPDTPSQESSPSNLELLAYGPENSAVIKSHGKLDLDQEEVLANAKEKSQQNKGRESIQTLRGNQETRFTPLDARSLQEKFGGGKAKLDEGSGGVEIYKDASGEEKASFESARDAIQKLSSYLEYIDISNEMARNGGKIEDIINARADKGGTIKNNEQYINARTEALNFIISKSPALFKDIDISKMDENDKLHFVEDTIAKDPIFRNSIAKTLKEASQQAENLPKIESDEELNTASQNAEEAKTEQEAAERELDGFLKDLGFEMTDERKANFNRLMSAGRFGEAIQIIQDSLLDINKFPKYADFLNFIDLNNQLKNLDKERKDLGDQQTSYANDKRNSYKDVEARLKTLNIDQNSQEWKEFEKILRVTNSQKDPTTNEYLGLIPKQFEKINKLKQTQNDFKKLQERRGPLALVKEKTVRLDRLKKESDIIDLLDNAVGNAAADALDARYDAVYGAKSEAVKKEREKKMSEDEKKITRAMDKNWIEYSFKPGGKRERNPDSDNINNDMKYLAYYGQDGVKRMLLRELGWKYKKDDGTEAVIDKNAAFNEDIFDKLSDEQKKQLDELTAKHADKYREKLMVDFTLLRTRWSRFTDTLPGTDKMGLKNYEWQLLEKNFPGAFEKAMNESQAFKNSVSQLEARGIKPDFKMKWFLWLISILGVGAATMAFGIAPAALTGAELAKGAGQTAWSGAL